MANQTYFCTLTAIGEAKDANAKALGTALKLTEMAVGDGNGALPTPDRTRTALVRQVRRAPLNTLKPDPQNPGQLIAEQIIPEDVGGWWIRELGIYDDAGDLIAIGNCPETYKPQLAEGSGRVQVVRMVLIMSSAASVQLKIDPAVVLATRKYADDQDAQVRQAAVDQAAAHVAAADPHPQYLTEAEGAARIQAAVQALVNSSPATLDTLAELAAALNNDKDFAVTMANALATKAPLASPRLTGIMSVANGGNVIGAGGQLDFYALPGSNKPGASIKSYLGWAGGNEEQGHLSFMIRPITYATGAALVEGMRLTSNGRLGLGTDSPDCKIHVMGTAKFGTSKSTVFINMDDVNGGFTQYQLGATISGYFGVAPALVSNTTAGDIAVRSDTGSIIFSRSSTESARFDSSGNLLVGTTGGIFHVVNKATAEGGGIIEFDSFGNGGTGVTSVQIRAVAAGSVSNANTAMVVGKNSATARSINAAGTVNASGADYAEYMTKAPACGEIAKGQIVGINAAGLLVDTWADAVSFLIKSTDPSYVGGDVWGTEEALGLERPALPVFEAPTYTGSTAPAALEEGEESTSERDAAVEQYQVDQEEYAAQVAAARQHFDVVIVPAYQATLADFEAKLEAARQRVDRIAYCGQVPVNVTGAKPGQYVVPVQDGNRIAGQLVDAAAVTFDQYRRAVGIVQNILPDGRANVRVKPV